MIMNSATPAQVSYCRDLFRKAKMFYRCLDDAALAEEVQKRTRFDLNNLSHDDAVAIIENLKREVQRQRRSFR